jgi:hypothetical protein
MQVSTKSWVVIVLLISVMAVFISPSVDLEPSALRSLQAANMFFAVLVFAGSAIAGLLHFFHSTIRPNIWPDVTEGFIASLVDLNCIRLC